MIKRFFWMFFALCTSASISAQCYELVWSEEFDGTALDLSTWNYEVNCDGGGNNELQCYTSSTNNVSVANGKLTITAIEENYLGHDYTSGRINSTGKFAVKYGKIEANLKLPFGQGIWPAFWMLPEDWVYGGWPNSGEIDIMEVIGQEPNKTYGTLHTGQPYSYQGNNYTLPSGDFSDAFHVFGIEWEENEIRWYVDGILFGTLGPGNVQPWAPFNEEFHLLLNLAVGGNWPGSPNGSTIFPQIYEADWIRVYKELGDLNIVGDASVAPNEIGSVYTAPQINGATYSWNVPAGASISGGSGTNEIMVDWGCDVGQISLDITGTCGTQTLFFDVTIDNEIIEGDNSIPPFDTGVAFSVPSQTGATYIWSVPGGATISSGQGTSSILVDWGDVGGLVTVEVVNSCGTNFYSFSTQIGPADIFCNFEDLILAFEPFGGNDFNQIPNPLQEGINTSNNVGRTNTGADIYSGIFADLGGELDFTESSVLSIKVWSPIACELQFKIEDISNTGMTQSINTTITETNQWVEYFFDFSGQPSNTFDRIALFFDIGTGDYNTFYFDDIFLGSPGTIAGCTDVNANNFNPSATQDDGSCTYDITFEVNMNCESGFTNVYVTGPQLGWCASCWPLFDGDGDGIYSNTFSFAPGSFEYKYQVDEWASQEDLVDDMLDGASCAPITDYATYANRIVEIGSVFITNDTYNTCGGCYVPMPGCTYAVADNYNPSANIDDGSCTFSLQSEVCYGDADGNGMINVLDLVAVSSNFGNICP